VALLSHDTHTDTLEWGGEDELATYRNKELSPKLNNNRLSFFLKGKIRRKKGGFPWLA
jgi:hypothetical protein